MTIEIYQQRLAAARGDHPIDLLLTNLQLVNVLTGEIYPSQIAIHDGVIVGLDEVYEAKTVLNMDGRFVAPGLIDAHVHIESSLCIPTQFARAVVPHGVTTVVTDPHEIANVLGIQGIQFMLDASEHTPLSVLVMASSCVPATHMETSGATLLAQDLIPLIEHPRVIGLAEVMNFPGVVFGDEGVLAKLEAFQALILDGHCPGLSGKPLNAYGAVGIGSDHECTTIEEAREKLRKGLTIFMREATNARNLETLLPLVTPQNSRQICFCTDDRQPADLLDDGSIDFMIRMAIKRGVDPITAFRMGTINPAEYFRLHDRGAIALGRRADLIVFPDLQMPQVDMVFCQGQLVVEQGMMRQDASHAAAPDVPPAMQIDWEQVDPIIHAESGDIRVIGSVDGQLVTGHHIYPPTIENGQVVADVERDLLKMLVIERHTGSGHVGKGIIQGIGLQRGAIAGTVAHDHHNLVVIGVDDLSLMTAARAVAEMGGGLAAVEGETVLATLALPIGGLMSDAPIETVREQMAALIDTAAQLGSAMHDPFMAMSFMALEVIPSLKLTDIGLVDVDAFEPVSLFVSKS